MLLEFLRVEGSVVECCCDFMGYWLMMFMKWFLLICVWRGAIFQITSYLKKTLARLNISMNYT